MGFRKPLDYDSFRHQLWLAGVELTSKYNDGFTQWNIKQDLYRIKWLIDEILASSDTFVGEQEFVDENSAKRVWRILAEK